MVIEYNIKSKQYNMTSGCLNFFKVYQYNTHTTNYIIVGQSNQTVTGIDLYTTVIHVILPDNGYNINGRCFFKNNNTFLIDYCNDFKINKKRYTCLFILFIYEW